MKELSIEEKAKRYDEALARANEMIKDMTNMGGVAKVDDIQYIFPELKESEDERTRKGLIEYFLHYPDHEITYYDLKADFVIAWLEKQGNKDMGISEATKQELKDNLNKALEKETPESYNEFLEKQGEQKYVPKFKVGDTIAKKHNSDINDFGSFTITDITGGKYWYNDRIICDITEQDEWELYEPVRQKPAWSEEDENRINRLIAYFEDKESFTAEDDVVYANWLKSLRPQSHWKPSDEQMVQLSKYCPDNIALTSLYEQLKKLKG